MRVISLVPSLTETLIKCGVNVVGRTRFCIHPADKVKHIKIIGGTKNVNWTKCAELKPDIVIFDKEENLKKMAEQCPYPWHATHITSVTNISEELNKLAQTLNSPALAQHAQDWFSLSQIPQPTIKTNANLNQLIPSIAQLPNSQNKNYQRIEYIIWRDPWMAIGQNTFIYSVLKHMGLNNYLPTHQQAYPTLHKSDLKKDDTFYLFSSEPYPFAKHQPYLTEQGFNGAIVDGELFSWYGWRSYQHLHHYLDSATNAQNDKTE